MSRQAWIRSIAELFVRRAPGHRGGHDIRRQRVDIASRGRVLEQLESRCVLAAPDAPFGLLPVSGNQQVALSWTAPANDGGFTITDYIVRYREAAAAPDAWTPFDDGISATPSALVTSLANGTSYVFQVAAVNEDAPDGGPFSANSTAATPAGLPFAPTDLVAAVGDASAALTWTVPDGNGAAITSYVVEITNADTDEATTKTFVAGTGDTQTVTVTSLVNGTPYLFNVAALNDVGYGPASYDSWAMPLVPAAAPGNLSAIRGNRSATLGWASPSDATTSNISQYQIQASSDGIIWTNLPWPTGIPPLQTTGVTVGGLNNGTPYQFRVAAVNAAGTGAWSGIASVTPATVPATVLGADPDNDLAVTKIDAPAAELTPIPLGDSSKLFTRHPRMAFEEACTLA